MKLNKKQKTIFLIIDILLVLIVLLFFMYIYNKEPVIIKYDYSKEYNEDKTLDTTLNLRTYFNDKVYCKFITEGEESKWIISENNKCTYPVKTGEYTIKLKYNNKVVEYKKDFNIDKVISIKINDKRKYMAVGASYNINTTIDYVGDVDTSIKYTSSNGDIISINENGDLYAIKDGTVTISAKTSNKLVDKFEITATSLIRPRTLDNNKEIVSCNAYTKEQVDMLDDILNDEVERAGPGTRAGVVAAATFLPMEFPYKIPYFYENGRLSNADRIVDGEGRWYHKGLYLGEDKQNTVKNVLSGPSSWGCSLMNWHSDGSRSPG